MRRAAIAGVVVLLAAATVAGAVPAADPSAKVVARFPSDGEMVEQTVVSPSGVETVSESREGQTDWQVPVTLTDSAAASFAETLVDAGFTGEGVQSCEADAERNDEGYCLLTVVDGNVVSAYGLGPGLADAIESGSFESNPQFLFMVQNETTAERVALTFGWQPSKTTTATGSITEKTSETIETTTESDSGESSAADVPGFGVVAALLAVAVAIGGRRTH
ncbi:hypothetical protein HALDL1_06540 [Halobacterium sp. DL1]|jgi:cobalamin biosynthesis Mg chelatase CobN|nr:hypothetical protein HALDL1_06540 [Halobacterium sp. DL1]